MYSLAPVPEPNVYLINTMISITLQPHGGGDSPLPFSENQIIKLFPNGLLRHYVFVINPLKVALKFVKAVEN